MSKTAATLMLLVFGSSCFARIGETQEQIETRYGKSIGPVQGGELGETKGYSFSGFIVGVTFLNGVSALEVVVKADSSEISEAELKTLLEANSGGFPWGGAHLEGQKETPGVDEFRSIDQRSRVAFYDRSKRSFYVSTQDFIDRTDEKKKEHAAEKLKKF